MAVRKWVGKNAIVQFVYAGGTYPLTKDGDWTSIQWEDSVNTADLTSAGDAVVHEEPTTRVLGLSMETFFVSGGTVDWSKVTPGNKGTILFGPRGTNSGYEKGGFVGYVKSRSLESPYADGIKRSVEFGPLGGAVLFDIETATW